MQVTSYKREHFFEATGRVLIVVYIASAGLLIFNWLCGVKMVFVRVLIVIAFLQYSRQ